MSTDKDKPAKAKKGKGLATKILLGLALVGAGGGGAFGLLAAGIVGGQQEEDNTPKLVLKGEEDPYAIASKEKDEGGELVHGDGGSKYRTAYFTFTDAFTSNLRGSDVMLQVSLAASTQYDGRVLMWLREHELAIQSQILVEIADTTAEELDTPEGKQALQQRLTKAINTVLEEQEGFGGVDDVHFRTFIVQ